MKVHNSVKLEITKEEKDAIQIVYNMLYEIEPTEERSLDDAIATPATIEDVIGVLSEIWELSGFDTDTL